MVEKYMFAVDGIPFIVIGNVIRRLEPIRCWKDMVKFIKAAVVEYEFPDASAACIAIDENNYTLNGAFVIWGFLDNIKSSTKNDKRSEYMDRLIRILDNVVDQEQISLLVSGISLDTPLS